MLVLLVEDESDLAQLTIDYLAIENIECDYAYDGEMALNLLVNNQYDVIVLDVNMPKLDGFRLAKKLRADNNDTPIIFVTARDDLADKLTGFASGADDYLTKPFDVEELAARIMVLSQRKIKTLKNFYIDDLTIDFATRKVTRGDRDISLSPKQWLLLNLLAQKSPEIIDKITLENAIWPDQIPSKDMFKTLVFRLRTLIDHKGEPPLIHTIRGVGIALREAS